MDEAGDVVSALLSPQHSFITELQTNYLSLHMAQTTHLRPPHNMSCYEVFGVVSIKVLCSSTPPIKNECNYGKLSSKGQHTMRRQPNQTG
jgi:hypothetical protein